MEVRCEHLQLSVFFVFVSGVFLILLSSVEAWKRLGSGIDDDLLIATFRVTLCLKEMF
jgi:hypothetical protein